jgi:type IV secretion system protein VirB8
MSGVPANELKEYFERAKRFDEDRLAGMIRQRNAAFAFVGLLGLVAAAEGFALGALTPLKEKIPFVVQEDKTTGIPQLVSTLTDVKETEPEAISKYFLTQYVSARESYLDAEAPFAFHKVSLMSGPAEQKRFALWYNGTNVDSPQIIYGKREVSEIHLRAITFLSQSQAEKEGSSQLAQVHFTRFVRDIDGDQSQGRRTEWVATIQFQYDHRMKMSDTDRLINPIGFWVTQYRLDPEVLAQ